MYFQFSQRSGQGNVEGRSGQQAEKVVALGRAKAAPTTQ